VRSTCPFKGKFGLYVVITLGGLRVNEEPGNVIRPDGSVIEAFTRRPPPCGLCAIGYFSGVSLSDGVFSVVGGEAASGSEARLHDWALRREVGGTNAAAEATGCAPAIIRISLHDTQD